MSLSALLERVEGATGPNFELERALFETFELPQITEWFGSPVTEWFRMGAGYGFNTADGARHLDCIKPGPYTASVDAALALIGRVLPGWIVCALDEWEDDVLRAKGPWMAVLKERGVRLTAPNPSRCQHAPTPALALCAALLAAMIGEEAKP